MPPRKLTRADLDALNRRVPGIHYPPGQDRPQLTTPRKPRQPKGRRSR
jgi:hypothetical protein